MRVLASLVIAATVLAGCSIGDGSEAPAAESTTTSKGLPWAELCPQVKNAVTDAFADPTGVPTQAEYDYFTEDISDLVGKADQDAYSALRQLEASSKRAAENADSGLGIMHPSAAEWDAALADVGTACDDAGVPLD